MDNYNFQIVQKGDDVSIIINNATNKFIGIINEDTFKLPYLKNKDVLKFMSKIIDKHSDNILKMDYLIQNIDAETLQFNIYLYDGEEHNYKIILKSKDTLDQEILEEKIKNIHLIQNDKLLDINRKYDDIIDEIYKKIDIENNNLKNIIEYNQNKNEYHNYKFKSLQIIKSMNKTNKFFEIYNESEDQQITKINNEFYEKLYDELKKYNDFINYIFKMYSEKQTNDPLKKIKYSYNYLNESNIYNILEFIFNIHGIIEIIYLNLDYNKSTQKITCSIKFLYDNSEYKNYKCLPSLYNQQLINCKLIYNSINNTTIYKKDILNVFIFQKLK
jgi:hypothetical protein